MPNSCRPIIGQRENARHDASEGRSNQTKETGRAGQSRNGAITSPCDHGSIDPRHLIRPYLVPDGEVGHHAFAVIREACRPQGTRQLGV